MNECPTYNFTIYQGATWERRITWSDDDDKIIDLSSYSARMQIRAGFDSATAIISLTSEGAGGITLGSTEPNIIVTISATQTAAMTVGGWYDLELVSSGGIVTRLLMGKVTFSRNITR